MLHAFLLKRRLSGFESFLQLMLIETAVIQGLTGDFPPASCHQNALGAASEFNYINQYRLIYIYLSSLFMKRSEPDRKE